MSKGIFWLSSFFVYKITDVKLLHISILNYWNLREVIKMARETEKVVRNTSIFIWENEITAFGGIQYANLIFLAVFLSFGIGTAPIINYNYDAGRLDELQNMYRGSLHFIGISGLLLFTFTEIFIFP